MYELQAAVMETVSLPFLFFENSHADLPDGLVVAGVILTALFTPARSSFLSIYPFPLPAERFCLAPSNDALTLARGGFPRGLRPLLPPGRITVAPVINPKLL